MEYWNNTEMSKKEPVLNIVKNWITESSRPALKTQIITASLVLLEFYRIFANLSFVEITQLNTFKSQTLERIYKLPHYNHDDFSSQISRLCLPLILFHSAFDKAHEPSLAGMHLAQNNFIQIYYIPFLQ